MRANGSEARVHGAGTAVTIGITAYDIVAPIQGVDEWLRQREAVLMAENVDRSRRYMQVPGVWGPGLGPNS